MMDCLKEYWQTFKQSPGKWLMALLETGLLVSERGFEIATLVQFANNGDRFWFRWTIFALYFPAFSVVFDLLISGNKSHFIS